MLFLNHALFLVLVFPSQSCGKKRNDSSLCPGMTDESEEAVIECQQTHVHVLQREEVHR